MATRTNALGQPIGEDLPGWTERPRPPRTVIEGRYARIEPLDPARHVADLHAANREDREDRIWTYLAYGPFASLEVYRAWMQSACLGDDPLFHAIVDRESGKASGVASFLRIEPKVGVIEVGHINYAPSLQRTKAATESMFLLMGRVFDELGYRRYEWKCDALNAPSRKAAQRSANREAVLRSLGIDRAKDFSTYEFLGNIGTVSLPLTAAVAEEREFLKAGDRVGWLGIGSGLNCMMLGVEW